MNGDFQVPRLTMQGKLNGNGLSKASIWDVGMYMLNICDWIHVGKSECVVKPKPTISRNSRFSSLLLGGMWTKRIRGFNHNILQLI